MADQRLEVLMKKSEAQYTEGRPILLEASALYLDKTTNNCIAQLKWKNIDPCPIKAVMIELVAYDAFNQKLEPIHYQYDGLLVTQGAEFGSKTPIVIKNNKVVKYDVILKAVSFSDETIQRFEEDAVFETLPENKPQKLEGETLDQLKRDLAKQGNKNAASFSPQKAMGLWQCGCGSWQYADSQCLKCRITQKTLEEASDEFILTKHLMAYKEEQEKLRIEAEKKAEEARIAWEKAEKERKEREETERKRREEQDRIAAEEAARRRTKHKKIGIITTVLLVVLAVAGCVVVTNIQKTNKYNDAVALVKANSFEEARTALTELGEYKDCLTLLKQVDANEMWAMKRYAEAYDIYSTLPADYQIHAGDYEYNYNLADTAEKEGDYEKASLIYALLGKYKDSAARHDAAEICRKETLAEDYKATGQYGDARNIYLELGYEEQATECLYLQADSQATSQPWLAYDGFTALGDYKDSPKRASELYGSRFEKIDEADVNGLRKYYDIKSSGYGLLDSKADVVVNPEYSFLSLNENNTYTAKKDEEVGVIDSTGKTIIPFEYDGINVKGGNYHVEKKSLNGVFNSDGSVLIPVEYDSISIKGDQYEVVKNEKNGILAAAGTVIIPAEYDKISVLEDGRYDVIKDGKAGILAADASVIIPAEYDKISVLEDGRYNVVKDGKAGILAADASVIISPEYDKVTVLEDGRYEVAKARNVGVLASDGSSIVPASYSTIKELDDGRYLVSSDRNYGIVDSKGTVIIQPAYDSVTYENTNTYTVKKGGKYGIIKYDGTVAHEANMELIKAGSNDGKYLMFKENGMYGFMDANTFAVIVPAEWKEVTIMTDGYAYIRNNLDNWGVIDSKGTVTVTPQWKYISYYKDCGYATRSEDGSSSWSQYYLMNNRGKLVCDFKDDIEYLGNGVFRNERGEILYSVNSRTVYSYTVNECDVSHLNMLSSDLLSGYFKWDSSWSSNYCYGVMSISRKKVITSQPWETEICKIPSRNEVNGKYGWIGADGKDLISPIYDFMMARTINGYIVAAQYNDRGNLVYSLLDPSTGKVAAKDIKTRNEAFNYFGTPSEDMSTHGQVMWALTNAGFNESSARSFIEKCKSGSSYSAEDIYEKINASREFKNNWYSLKSDIGSGRVNTEEKLLEKLTEYGLN